MRKIWLPLLLLILGVFVLSDRAQSEEHEHGKLKYKALLHGGKELIVDPSDHEKFAEQMKDLKDNFAHGNVHEVIEDKPFDPLNLLRADQGLWTIVIFLLLFFILKKVAWGPMLEGLQKREQNIRAAADEAKEARKETERVRAEFKAEMDKAYAEIPKMMEAARRDAQNLAEEMRAKAQADIQTERQRLRREIETARDQALQELWSRTSQLATLISSKAIRRSLSEEDHRRLMDEALNELRDRERRTHDVSVVSRQ